MDAKFDCILKYILDRFGTIFGSKTAHGRGTIAERPAPRGSQAAFEEPWGRLVPLGFVLEQFGIVFGMIWAPKITILGGAGAPQLGPAACAERLNPPPPALQGTRRAGLKKQGKVKFCQVSELQAPKFLTSEA